MNIRDARISTEEGSKRATHIYFVEERAGSGKAEEEASPRSASQRPPGRKERGTGGKEAKERASAFGYDEVLGSGSLLGPGGLDAAGLRVWCSAPLRLALGGVSPSLPCRRRSCEAEPWPIFSSEEVSKHQTPSTGIWVSYKENLAYAHRNV